MLSVKRRFQNVIVSILLGSFAIFLASLSADAAVWRLDPSITLSGSYNDNLQLLSDPDKREVYGRSFSPALSFHSLSGKLDLRGTLSSKVTRYSKASRFDTTNYLFSFSPQYRLDRGIGSLNTSYLRDTSLQQELLETGLALKRADRSALTLNPTWRHSFTERSSLHLSYNFKRVDFVSGPAFGLFDFKDQSASASLNVQVTDVNNLTASLSYSENKVSVLNLRSETFSTQIGGGHRFSDSFQARLSLGGFHTIQHGSLGRKGNTSRGILLSGSTSKSFEMTQISASVSRQIIPSGASSLLKNDQYTVSLSRTIDQDLHATLSASFFENRFLREDAPREKSRFYSASSSLSWQWAERSDIRFGYSYSRQAGRISNAENILVSYRWEID